MEVKKRTFGCSSTIYSTMQQAKGQGYQSTPFESENHATSQDIQKDN